jgi:meiotically up-regulated gene 157 (Mug157) protein
MNGYHIPSNMFSVVVLGYIAEIAATVYQGSGLARSALALQSAIDSGIKTYGIYQHERQGPIYAYKTDGQIKRTGVPFMAAIRVT